VLLVRTVLIEPPKFVKATNHLSIVAMPPLGLAYVAAALRAHGHDVKVIDAVGEAITRLTPFDVGRGIFLKGLTDEEIIARIPADAAMIGVSCMFSYQWLTVRGLLNSLKDRFPRVPLVVGGEHPTGLTEEVCSTSRVDYVVLGEGEETIVALAECVSEGRDASGLAGLASRTSDGSVRINPRRGRIKAIDAIEPPAWELFNLETYIEHNQPHGASRGRFIPVLATRGCPFQCTFCTSPQMWTTQWTPRDPARVVDEMESYMRRYGIVDFQFEDLTAIVRKDWILSFCEEIRRRKLALTFQLPSGTRSEAVDGEVAVAMKAAGCHEFAFAPESGDARVLQLIKKKVSLPRMFDSARRTMQAGINVGCFFIIGFPEDTWRSILNTYGAIVRCAWLGFSSVNVNAYSPQPNTESFRRLRAEGRIPRFDDRYYLSLFTFQGLSAKTSYNERLGPRTLSALIVLGFALFYVVSFMRRPGRLAVVIRDCFRRESASKTGRAMRGMLKQLRQTRSASIATTRPGVSSRPR
jgi:anaerobic magnesium-protoporphyrin IX monomethyl ester cyclase